MISEINILNNSVDCETMIDEFKNGLGSLKKKFRSRVLEAKAYGVEMAIDLIKDDDQGFRYSGVNSGNIIISQGQAVQSVKVSRNELCPCGSGKKYKKCCDCTV